MSLADRACWRHSATWVSLIECAEARRLKFPQRMDVSVDTPLRVAIAFADSWMIPNPIRKEGMP